MRTLAVLSLLASAASAQEADRQGDTVSFEVKSGVIFVQVTVNGMGPFAFVLDTASSWTCLSSDTAKKLRIGLADDGQIIRARSLSVGKAQVQDLWVTLCRDSAGRDGILGYNFIARFVTTLDYKGKTLKLVPSDYVPVERLGGRLPQSQGPIWVGLSPRELGADEANEIGIDGGVVVQKVAKDSPAAKGGMKESDIIQEIDGKRIDTVEQYYEVLRKSKPGDTLTFRVIRDKKDVDLKVTVQERK